jgi:hypothetical protein
MANKSKKCLDNIFNQKEKVKFRATGNSQGGIAKVEASNELIELFMSVLKMTSITLLILKLIQRLIQSIKGGQILGVTGVEYKEQPNPGLYLLGYCLQRGKPIPEEGEELIEVRDERLEKLMPSLNKWLIYYKRNQGSILDELKYADNKNIHICELNITTFVQIGLWVITDDIPLEVAKFSFFGSNEFFTWEHLEVLLILNKHLRLAGIKKATLTQDIAACISHNFRWKAIPRVIIDEWQRRYKFEIFPKNSDDKPPLYETVF